MIWDVGIWNVATDPINQSGLLLHIWRCFAIAFKIAIAHTDDMSYAAGCPTSPRLWEKWGGKIPKTTKSSRKSQRLTVMHTAVHHLVPQRLMHALGHFIVDPGI